MGKIFKLSEFQSPTGQWHCGNYDDLANNSNVWWRIPRFLRIPLDEYVKLLVETFKVDYIKYDTESDLLSFSWSNQSSCRKFKNFVNQKAKIANYQI